MQRGRDRRWNPSAQGWYDDPAEAGPGPREGDEFRYGDPYDPRRDPWRSRDDIRRGARQGGYGGHGDFGPGGYGGSGRGGRRGGYGSGGYGGSDFSTGGYPGARYGESGFYGAPHRGPRHAGEYPDDDFGERGDGGYRGGAGGARVPRSTYYGSPSGEGGGYVARADEGTDEGPRRRTTAMQGYNDVLAGYRSDRVAGYGEEPHGEWSPPRLGRPLSERERRRTGPKGYRRTDERIREDLCERLAHSGRLDVSDVEVAVEGGVVTLTGSVPERQQKYLLEDIAEEVFGVEDVRNEVRVQRGTVGEGTVGSRGPV
jgi:hypothetical protein